MAQPANDSCAVVSGGGFDIPAAGGTVNGTTALATVDGDCSCDGGTAGRDVYYRFTPSASGTWRLSLCGGTTIDTVVSVHTSCPADASTQIACDDDSCGGIGVLSRVNATLNAGTTYIVRVGMWSAAATGGAFTLDVTLPTAINNDSCATVDAAAASIPGAGGVIAGTTESATSDGFCSCDDGDGGAIDVYYKFIPNASSTWSFSLCAGSNLDSAMSLHSGCPADTFNEIICNDDGCGGIGVPSSFTVSLTAGTPYILRVGMWDSFNTAGDPFVLTVENFSAAGACCNATTGVCSISASGAGGCSSGTTFQGTNTVCTPNPCPQPPPPANDECAGAFPLVVGGPAIAGTNLQSTDSGVTHSCTGSTLDVWYTFTAAAAGSFIVTVDSNTADLISIVAYSGCGGTEIACQAALVDPATLLVGVATPGTYAIRVATFTPATTYTISIATTVAGACCNSTSGACTISSTGAGGCGAGTVYQGNDSVCVPSPCPQEACCNASTGACTIAAVGQCASGTTGQGTGSSCSPINPCPQPPPPANDTCATAQALTLNVAFAGTTVQATGDGTEGPGGACYTTSTTNFGRAVWFTFTAPASDVFGVTACGSGHDTVLSVFDGTCAAFGSELGCDDDTCDGVTPAGSGLASIIAPISMSAGQTYIIRLASWGAAPIGGAYTITVTGTAPSGVCCRGATCSTTVTSSAACTGSLVSGQAAGASFPTGAACNTGGSTSTPCCYADYNKAGGITVGDIFDFLNDWFAGSPYANTGGNGSGGALAVQNIFDFLSAWFAGGC